MPRALLSGEPSLLVTGEVQGIGELGGVPPGPIAVAVMRPPERSGRVGSKEKDTLPRRLVVTLVWPRKVLPSSSFRGLLLARVAGSLRPRDE